MGNSLKLFKVVSLGSLRSDYLRVILTLLAIALGVATMLAIRLANSAAVESFRTAALTVNSGADLVLSTKGGIQAEDFPKIEGTLQEFGEVSPIRVGYLKAGEKLIKLYAVDFITSSIGDLDVEIGGFRDILSPGSIILSKALKDSLGEPPSEVLSPKGNLAIRLVGSFDSGQPVKYALCDLSQIPYFFGDNSLTRVELNLFEGDAEDRVHEIEEVKEKLEQLLPGFEVQTPLETLGGREKMVAAFHFNMTALGYISILVGLLVVLTVTTLSLRRRSFQLGLLRTLGASHQELKFVFLLENLMLGVPAIILGMFLGTKAAGFLIAASAETTAVFYLAEATQGALNDSSLDFREILFVASLALAAILLATELATRQLRGLSEMSILRSQNTEHLSLKLYNFGAMSLFGIGYVSSFLPPVEGLPVFGFCSAILYLLAAVLFFPAIFKTLLSGFEMLSSILPGKAVALTALSGSRTGLPLIVPAASSLVVSMAMTIAVLFMVGSFRETVKLWIEGALTADIVLRPALNDVPGAGGTLSASFMKQIGLLTGVDRVEPVKRGEIEFEGVSIDLVERRFESEGLPFFFKEQRCVDKFLKGEATIVSETFSLRFKKNIEDLVELRGADYPICGIHYDYAGVRGEAYLAIKDSDSYTTAAVFLKEGASAEEVKQSILGLLENPLGLFLVETSWLRAEVLRIFDQTFVITYAVLTLSLIIAGMGVFAALIILGLGQRSGLTMFRTLGASRSQVVISLLLQTSILAVASFIAALISGLLIGYVLAEVINPQSFFWTISLTVNPVEVLEVFLIFFATAFLASSVAVGMALRLNLREISRDE